MACCNLTMPNQLVKSGLKAKKIKLPQTNFSRKIASKISLHLLAPFILQNFKKILGAHPEFRECAIFGPKMIHLSWTKFFWYKPLLLLSSTYWPFSICKILKKSYSGSRIMMTRPFGPKMIQFPKSEFFRKPFNDTCFFNSRLSTCKKSKSDINLLVKFWRLKNTEISLAKAHFWL